MQSPEWILLGVLCAVQLVTIVLLLFAQSGRKRETENLKKDLAGQLTELRRDVDASVRNAVSALADAQGQAMSRQSDLLRTIGEQNHLSSEALRSTVNDQLGLMRRDNNEKLDAMRKTVDEKLETTLNTRLGESFRQVSDQLQKVYEGLGEMQTLATGVGDLKKVLSNVKTRGILGEVQLGAILEQILSPEQYLTNVVTVKGSKNPVEYAIRLPGAGEEPVLLPIDAKFPGDTYEALLDAYDSGDRDRVAQAKKDLKMRLRACAKDIHDKYVHPPETTEFAILFLPFEGLYAEAVNLGLIETLGREFKVNIAGPTTMAALLNSLQMGFRTLAIQQRSGEVWRVLGAVKTEFEKFSDVLLSVQKRIQAADQEVGRLITTRTNVMNRTLREVEKLDGADSAALLGISQEKEENTNG